MSETCLYDTESAHSPTWWVVGANRVTVDNGVSAFVWTLGVCNTIDENRC